MNPSPEHLELLRRLRQQLHHHNGGASVVYLFSDYTLANQWLVAELDTHLRANSMRLEVLTSASASELPAALLQPVLASGDQEMAGRHYWLALGNPAPEWDAYRDRVLARLNESRSVLVKNRVFVFLLLPKPFEGRAAEVAPDLWSIRSASHAVPPWRGRDVPLTTPAEISSESEWNQGSVPPAPADNPVLRNWQAQWEAWNKDRSQQLSPSLAWLLVDELVEQQQLDQAKAVAMQALELSRQLRVAKRDTPESLRDLSVSLNKVGDAESAAGRDEQALAAHQESLDIARQLRQALGESPQVLLDLSISLLNVGDMEREEGRCGQALAAYRESLDIARQLRQALGENPQVLRDLSVSLERVGNAEIQAGRGEQALDAYRESLEIYRQLRQALGENPQVLRDLSVSLEKVGNAESQAGRGELALDAYRESLEIRRQLYQALGENPQVLRDLSVSLSKVGDAKNRAGGREQALAAYRESLEITRQLRQALGDSPQVLDDLAVLLERLASQSSLEMQERQRHFDEALSLRERLVSALPQNTWYRQRLEGLRSLTPSLSAPSADT
jgi:tetratricopeptide (TPR) repeat protein